MSARRAASHAAPTSTREPPRGTGTSELHCFRADEHVRFVAGYSGRVAARVASTSRAIWATSSASLVERGLVAQALPELDDEPLAVEVAVEVEQERLDLAARRRRSAG